jgi:hypothetical protein
MTPRRALVWLVVLVALVPALYFAIRQTRDLTDFEVYRTAGARVLAAAPLYRPEDGHFVFKYLPAFAYAVVPFAIVGPETAKALWFVLSVGWLALFVWGSIRALPDRQRAIGSILAWTLLVTARCDIRELSLGQTNALLGALLVMSLLMATRGASRMAGALVGLATFIKPYTVLLVPWLAATVGLPALVACGFVSLAGLLVPAVSYGWSGNLDLLAGWFRTVTETTAPNLMLPENISFVSAWAKWIGAGPAATALAVATTVSALGLVGVSFMRRGNARHPAYLEFALLLLLIPVLTPQGWDYMLLLATPAVVCLVDRWAAIPSPWKIVVGVALTVIALPMREVFGLAVTRQVMGTGVLTLAALGLVAALMQLRWRGAA